ncbi:MAG: hypothetical protein CVV27_07850 [Candidatus Melainabacteria bacterium HGW-Melainabacteria-1]|nr:MAG: hypothetical protein CVV27_07850 [Candidatus Melainabacteria bacterium HGW-Melainabacteria-1]
MPAIQAMRSDALALRAKEDVQEKIPSFYNSVNQSLGQSVVTGQDAAEQLLEQRFQAANQIAAQLRQKVDGQGGLAELTAGAGLKLISSALNTILMALSKTTTTDLIEIASDIANFLIERKTLQLQWDAAAATYAQWTVQAGYTGNGDFFPSTPPAAPGPGPYTQTFVSTQWLRVPPAGAVPANGTASNANFLNGASYSTQTGALPAGLTSYTVLKPQGTDPETYANVGTSVIMDKPTGTPAEGNDGIPGEGDFPASLFQAGNGDLYLNYSFEYQVTGTSGTTGNAPTVSGTINNVNYNPGGAGNTTIQFSNPALGASHPSTSPYTISPPRQLQVSLAMGGRGALKYRDALTPRFTDRAAYGNSTAGWGAGLGYESYYAWGSVGSISRVGQY